MPREYRDRDNPILSSSDLFGLAVRELTKSVEQPNILNVGEKVYPEQDRFFASQKMGRFISGGNRGGKSDAGVIDAVQTILGTHPFRKRPDHWGTGPLQIRFVVSDVSVGIMQTMVPKFQRWVPETEFKGGSWERAWDSNNYIITFKNGSTVDFVTHKMELTKLGGVPRHAIYFDEEPPRDLYNECMMRLVDYEGYWVIMATPTRGITWTNDLLWEPAQDPENEKASWIDTFTLDPASNPYNQATPESMQRYLVGMDEEEVAIRMRGEFVAKSGLVFPKFGRDLNVWEPYIPPHDWAWYTSTDHGWNNPTAWLWHAVGPKGQIITFAEHYASQMIVGEHAQLVKMRERSWGRDPDEPPIRTGDPAMGQTQGVTGVSIIQEYARHGVYIGVDGVPRGAGSVMVGIEKMQQYLTPRADSPWGPGRPMWVISSNCVNFLREMKKLRWASYESDRRNYDSNKQEDVHKRDDHTFDSARYFATLMPDLRPDTLSAQDAAHLSFGDFLARANEDEDFTIAQPRAGRGKWQTEYADDEESIWLSA